jgi:peptide/nickel transport system substrate-binding protein
MTIEQINALKTQGVAQVLAKTVSKPWKGQDFVPGRVGGTWNAAVTAEPKSFNMLVAERDGPTSAIVGNMTDWLVDYNVITKKWRPRAANYEIKVDEKAGTLDVIYTLRDDLYWSWYNNAKPRVKVTSDDVVFWYNNIEGNPDFQSSGYNGQFLAMPSGRMAHIDIKKIDDRRFAFHFPRIVANPLLETNRDIKPKLMYEGAYEKYLEKKAWNKAHPKSQVDATSPVLDILSIATDPRTIPSMGRNFLVEYSPAQRMVYKRNPDFWEKDINGAAVNYPAETIVQILPDTNTQFLIFKEGKIDAYSARPEDLNELILGARNKKSAANHADYADEEKRGTEGYTVFNAEGSLGALLWSFNQNPKNKGSAYYDWFTKKEFRQAMSCILNRARLASQVYRGLAQPKLDFFPAANPYYNPDIKLQYTYDPARAVKLLASIGMKRDGPGTKTPGTMRDSKGRAIEFDLSIMSDANTTADTASIIMDEAAKIGVKVNVRTLDFQKLVDQLTKSYDWQSLIIGLGTNFFPTQGSNVWPTTGNLHLWYPLQPKPATAWEARVDYLYTEGSYTIDHDKAQKIWDEYQRIILEQCPVIYLMRARSFTALRNRWNFSNVYYDNLNGFETTHIFLEPGD